MIPTGMDLYSKVEGGAYFRRNVWGWHPLADYVIDLHPDLAAKVTYWHTNDGDGLDGPDSAELARRLREQVTDGTARRYVEIRDAEIAALPRETCTICLGKGKRSVEDDIRLLGHPLLDYNHDLPCNGCHGAGTTEPWAASYRLEVDDVAEFAEFLEQAAKEGGFEID